MSTILILIMIAICLAVLSAAGWYLTVEKTFNTNGVDLFKMSLFALPLFVVIGVGLYILRCLKRDRSANRM
ncbi:MAG TPA: hypothetical protein VLY20_10835 [Nitrospiria bacterium]|nr:hypothetical protein [Nitrospiria bacterium]